MLEGMLPVDATSGDEWPTAPASLAAELLELYVGDTMLEGIPPVDATVGDELLTTLATLATELPDL